MHASISRSLTVVVAALAALGVSGGFFSDSRAHAANAPATPAPLDTPVDDAAVDFLKQTAATRLATIELGNLAQERGSTPSLTAFAKGMVGQESLLLERLRTLAEKLGVPLPVAPTEKLAEKLDRLQAKSQEDFEKAFLDFVAEAYERDLVAFEFASSVPNLDVRQFAIQYRDMFQRQLDEIKQLTQPAG